MFGLHGAQFERLVEAGMDVEQVHVLKMILANPDIELRHHGKITFTGKVVGQSISSTRWAKCIFNWDYNSVTDSLPSLGGDSAFVMAQECEDRAGQRVKGGAIKIYLPAPPCHDPNVEKGDVVTFYQASDGSYVAPGYGDNRVGSILFGLQGDTKVPGWGVMNGTNNATTLGGSGIDARQKFLRQWNATGDNKGTGGSATDSVTVGSHSGGSVDSAITIATHSAGNTGNTTISEAVPHVHELDNSSTVTSAASGTPVNVVTVNQTGNPIASLSHSAHNHTTPALSHSVSGSSALSHGAVSVDTLPPFVDVAMFERLNNSRSGTGD